MITEKELEQIHLLSDNELYKEAVEFMQAVKGTLPPTQMNGLLNIMLNSYGQLNLFMNRQLGRTWPTDQQYVPEFYSKLKDKLKDIEDYVVQITPSQQEALSEKKQEKLKMLLVREFIQHLMAENAYKAAKPAPNQSNKSTKPTQNKSKNQPHRGNRRGPSTR